MQKKKEFNYITFVADKKQDLDNFIECPGYGEKIVVGKLRIASLENYKTVKIFDLQPYINLKKPQSFFLSTRDICGIVRRNLVAFKAGMKEFDFEYTMINTQRLTSVLRKKEELIFEFESGRLFSLVFSDYDLEQRKVENKEEFFEKIDALVFEKLKEKMGDERYKQIYKKYMLTL